MKVREPNLRVVKLPGSRYCFTREVLHDPLPHYEHLVLHHRRRQRRIEARWSYSLFPVFELGELPEGFQVESAVWRKEFEEDWDGFLQGVTNFRATEGAGLLSRLSDNTKAHLPIWHAYRNLELEGVTSEELDAARKLVGTKGFSMLEPTAVRVGGFLSDFVPQGVQVEPGVFSLESNRARQKLASFQLEQPRDFVFHLIAGAIASGAPSVSLYVDSDDVIVEFGGPRLGPETLESLFSNLLAGKSSSREREFAVAFNAALSLEPTVLKLEEWRDGSGCRLEFLDGQERLTKLEESPLAVGEEGHRVHFRDKVSWHVAKRFVGGLRGHPEYESVSQRFRYAPVPVTQENRVDLRALPTEDIGWLFVLKHDDHALPTIQVSEGGVLVEESSGLDASVIIAFGPERGHHWMVHGMLHEPPVALTTLGAWVLVSDDKASRDISFSKIVVDRRVQEIADAVARLCADHLARFLQAYAMWPDDKKLGWLPFLQGLLSLGGSIPGNLPLFKVVAGGIIDRNAVFQHSQVWYATRDFSHPLETGERVVVIADPQTGWFDQRRLVDKTAELTEIETYHKNRAAWMERTPEIDWMAKGVESRYERLFASNDGKLYLLPDPRSVSRWEYFLENRRLVVLESEEHPEGLGVVMSSPRFRRDRQWKEFLQDDAYHTASAVARRQFPGFYRDLMKEGAKFGEHALSYVLYLERRGERWTNHLDELLLPTLAGGAVTLRNLLLKTPWDELPPNLRDLEGSWTASVQRRKHLLKGALAKAGVSIETLLRVRHLKL